MTAFSIFEILVLPWLCNTLDIGSDNGEFVHAREIVRIKGNY